MTLNGCETVFLNGAFSEEVYMPWPECCIGKDHLACKLNRSLYDLKQASRQLFLKFDQVITSVVFWE